MTITVNNTMTRLILRSKRGQKWNRPKLPEIKLPLFLTRKNLLKNLLLLLKYRKMRKSRRRNCLSLTFRDQPSSIQRTKRPRKVEFHLLPSAKQLASEMSTTTQKTTLPYSIQVISIKLFQATWVIPISMNPKVRVRRWRILWKRLAALKTMKDFHPQSQCLPILRAVSTWAKGWGRCREISQWVGLSAWEEVIISQILFTTIWCSEIQLSPITYQRLKTTTVVYMTAWWTPAFQTNSCTKEISKDPVRASSIRRCYKWWTGSPLKPTISNPSSAWCSK